MILALELFISGIIYTLSLWHDPANTLKITTQILGTFFVTSAGKHIFAQGGKKHISMIIGIAGTATYFALGAQLLNNSYKGLYELTPKGAGEKISRDVIQNVIDKKLTEQNLDENTKGIMKDVIWEYMKNWLPGFSK